MGTETTQTTEAAASEEQRKGGAGFLLTAAVILMVVIAILVSYIKRHNAESAANGMAAKAMENSHAVVSGGQGSPASQNQNVSK